VNPATGEALRVRDVILCANGPEQIHDGEFEAHPPVGMTPRLLIEDAVPVVDLGEGITLTQLDDDEAERVLNACSPRGHNFDPVRQFGQRYSFVRERVISDYRLSPFAFDEDGGLLRDALMLSRLVRDNGFSLQFGCRIIDRSGVDQMIVPYIGDYGKAAHRLRSDREWLDGAEAGELAALLAAYWAGPRPDRVDRAMWRCEWATWTPWADPMIPVIVSGLEALLKVGRRDLTAQFATRVPALAADLGIAGVDAALCAELYDGRSDWSHGSNVALFEGTGRDPTIEADEIRAKIARLQDVLRAGIRRAIEVREFGVTFEDDEGIVSRWPV
jgi:hypothetical protein